MMFLSSASSQPMWVSTVKASPNTTRISSLSQECFDQIAAATVETALCNPKPAPLSDRAWRLQALIQAVHYINRSGKCPPELALQLLDRAWDAQKLLWAMRLQQLMTLP